MTTWITSPQVARSTEKATQTPFFTVRVHLGRAEQRVAANVAFVDAAENLSGFEIEVEVTEEEDDGEEDSDGEEDEDEEEEGEGNPFAATTAARPIYSKAGVC